MRGPQYRPQNTIVLRVGTPKMVPLILRNPHIYPLLFRVQSFQAAGLGMKALALLFLLALEYMGDCQNYGLFWGTLNIRCRISGFGVGAWF